MRWWDLLDECGKGGDVVGGSWQGCCEVGFDSVVFLEVLCSEQGWGNAMEGANHIQLPLTTIIRYPAAFGPSLPIHSAKPPHLHGPGVEDQCI